MGNPALRCPGTRIRRCRGRARSSCSRRSPLRRRGCGRCVRRDRTAAPLLLARELGTLDLLSEAVSSCSRPSAGIVTGTRRSGCPFSKRGCSASTRRGVPLARYSRVVRQRALRLRGRVFDKAWHPDGPRLWLGGGRCTHVCCGASSASAHGFHLVSRPMTIVALRDLAAAGRDLASSSSACARSS
jgi:hypothetical protein